MGSNYENVMVNLLNKKKYLITEKSKYFTKLTGKCEQKRTRNK